MKNGEKKQRIRNKFIRLYNRFLRNGYGGEYEYNSSHCYLVLHPDKYDKLEVVAYYTWNIFHPFLYTVYRYGVTYEADSFRKVVSVIEKQNKEILEHEHFVRTINLGLVSNSLNANRESYEIIRRSNQMRLFI